MQDKTLKLRQKDYFNHMFLIHDYLYRFSRVVPNDSDHFNLQIDLTEHMNVQKSGLFGSILAAGLMVRYWYKGKRFALKVIFPCLYIYWWNHIYTLSSFVGAMLNLPSGFKRVEQYYQKHQQVENTCTALIRCIREGKEYKTSEEVVAKMFGLPDEVDDGHLQNQFFMNEGSKYVTDEMKKPNFQDIKVPYLDCFLTRYVYFTFTDWIRRFVAFLKREPLEK